MQDCWVLIFTELDIDSLLTASAVDQFFKNIFQQALPPFCSRHDLYPCTTKKELITAYAHAHIEWRELSSFSPLQRKHRKFYIQDMQPEVDDVEMYALWYMTRFPGQRPNILGVNFEKIAKKLDSRPAAMLSGRHSRMTKLTDDKSFCRMLCKYGCSPYYIEYYRKRFDLFYAHNKKLFYNMICSTQNEYLLRVKIRKEGHAFVDRDWQWPRGTQICQGLL